MSIEKKWFFGHNKIIARMKSQQLEQHPQDPYKLKPDKISAQRGGHP